MKKNIQQSGMKEKYLVYFCPTWDSLFIEQNR